MLHPDVHGDVRLDLIQNRINGVLHTGHQFGALIQYFLREFGSRELTVARFDLQPNHLHHALLLRGQAFYQFGGFPFDFCRHVLQHVFLEKQAVFVFFENVR